MRPTSMRSGTICRHRKAGGCLRVLRAAQSGGGPQKPSQQAVPRDLQSRVRAAAQLTADELSALVQSPTVPRDLSARPRVEPGSAATSAEQDVWVFSYGGNMCYETLARRDVSVAQRDPAFVVDPYVRMVFRHRGGHATLLSLPAGQTPRFRPPSLESSHNQPCVHGVLYKMPKSHLKSMESREHGYNLSEMEVETYDGRRVRAYVWVSGPLATLPQEVTPPEMYMKKLREGAAFNFLDPAYQAWLSSIETVTSAGLPSEYFNTPGRYISYSLLMVSLTIVAGWFATHM